MARSRSTFGRVFRRKLKGAKLPGFYIRARLDGHEVTRWAGPDRKTAEAYLADLLRKTSRESLLGEKAVPAVSFIEARPMLDAYFTARHGASTFRGEKARLDRIVKHFGTRPIRDLTGGDVQSFLTGLRAAELSTGTVNRHLAALSVAFRFAVERGFALTNPSKGLPRPREEIPAVRFLSSADVDRLVASAADAPFAALVRVLADTGLRRGEALALEWRDADLARRVVVVRKSKSKRSREVPMTLAVHAALTALSASRAPIPMAGPDLVWPGLASIHPSCVTVRFQRAAKRVGFNGLRLHDLRHGCGSRLAQAGVPLPTIAAILGHGALTTTMRYANHLPGGATVDAMKRLDPAPAPAPAPKTDGATDSTGEGVAKGDVAIANVASRAAVAG